MKCLRLVILVFAVSCTFKDKGRELYGVVNGRAVRASDIQSRLNQSIQNLESATLDQKRVLFETVAAEMVLEDEMKRTRFNREKLFQVIEFAERVPVSAEERAEFLKKHPEMKAVHVAVLDPQIQKDRRTRLEAKYREELQQRSLIRFLWGNRKEAVERGLE